MKGDWIFIIAEKTLWIGLLVIIHFFVLLTFQGEVSLSALDGADRKAPSTAFTKPISPIAFHWAAAPANRQ